MSDSEGLDIIGNIKLIETYKNYLLSSVADLFMTMGKGSRMDIEEAQEELSEIILLSYLLSRKLGINYSSIDETLVRRLKIGLAEGKSMEQKCQDYSSLISYINGQRME